VQLWPEANMSPNEQLLRKQQIRFVTSTAVKNANYTSSRSSGCKNGQSVTGNEFFARCIGGISFITVVTDQTPSIKHNWAAFYVWADVSNIFTAVLRVKSRKRDFRIVPKNFILRWVDRKLSTPHLTGCFRYLHFFHISFILQEP